MKLEDLKVGMKVKLRPGMVEGAGNTKIEDEYIDLEGTISHITPCQSLPVRVKSGTLLYGYWLGLDQIESIIKDENPLTKQVGGDHYRSFAIQPAEFISKNDLRFFPADIIKRICRYDLTGGKGLEDLEKIKHEVDLIIALEGWKDDHQTE